MIAVNGTDLFSIHDFRSDAWSAPILQSPQELRDYLGQLGIVGQKIAAVKSIGTDCFFSRDWVEDQACEQLSALDQEERVRGSSYDTLCPTVRFSRNCTVDAPLLFRFDSGDVLALAMDRVSEVRASMNNIPWEAQTSAPRNFDAGVLFSNILGRTITDFEVVECFDISDSIPTPHGDDWIYQDSFIHKLILHLDSGEALVFQKWVDYFQVSAVDAQGTPLTLPFSELQPGLFLEEDA